MSFGRYEKAMLDLTTTSADKAQLQLLASINAKLDRQIALLERIILALENRQDDGR